MDATRLTSCAIGIAAMIAACSRPEPVADASSSAGSVVASPATASAPSSDATAGSIATASADGVGRYLTDGAGRALYEFERDTKNTSTCGVADGCAVAWPPYGVESPSSSDPSIQAAELHAITRGDARPQVAYAGRPLYHYEDDKQPGDIEGQGKLEFGGLWYLVSPSGQAIKTGGKPHR